MPNISLVMFAVLTLISNSSKAAPAPMEDFWNELNLNRIATVSSTPEASHASGSRTSRPAPHTRVSSFGELLPMQRHNNGSQTSRPTDRNRRRQSSDNHNTADTEDIYPDHGQSSRHPAPNYPVFEAYPPHWDDAATADHSQYNFPFQSDDTIYTGGFSSMNLDTTGQYHNTQENHGEQINTITEEDDASQDPSYASQMTITRPGPYIRPYHEYELITSSHIKGVRDLDEAIYDRLSGDQKVKVIEVIRSIRPYTAKTIQNHLATHLTAPAASYLLGSRKESREDAVESLFPMHAYRRDYTPWMTGLTNDHRRQVVEELSDATEQSADVIREQFVVKKVTPQLAIALLNCTTQDERRSFAIAHQLFFNEDPRARPWQKGLSKYQRLALLQRMTATGISNDYSTSLLRKYNDPPGIGKMLLRADDLTFMQWMAQMRNISR
ncbi:hypothetical protein CBS101457_003003 [Exobasidium rhododendri]|nr:hypothetical protein CBS101457_003003 [Exobasidium rhododendri]